MTPYPACAQEDFGRTISAVRQLFESQHYQQAFGHLEAAKQSALQPEQELAIALYEGLLIAHMNPRRQAAAEAFKRALRLDSEVRLPLKVSPRIARDFEALRHQIRAEKQSRPASVQPLSIRASGDAISSSNALIPSLTGAGLMLSGGVFWGLAKREQSRFQNGDLPPDVDPVVIAERGKTYQALGLSLLGAGVVGLGVGATLHVLRKPDAPVALGIGVGRTSVFVHGRWL
jgi:hypothetical protein